MATLNFGQPVSQAGVTNIGAFKVNIPAPVKKPTTGVLQKIGSAILPTTNTSSDGMHLFSDEQNAISKMKKDGLKDDEINSLIKQRRAQLIPGALTDNEKSALIKMQADGLSSEEASNNLKQYREQNPTTAPQPEGLVSQTLNAPGRGVKDYLKSTAQGLYQGGVNTAGLVTQGVEGLLGNTPKDILKKGEEKVIGKTGTNIFNNILSQLPGNKYTDVLNKGLSQPFVNYSPQEQQALQTQITGVTGAKNVGQEISGAVKGGSTGLFNIVQAPTALGLNIAGQTPGTKQVLQGVSSLLEGTANKIAETTGADPQQVNDYMQGAMNLFGTKGLKGGTLETTGKMGEALQNAPTVAKGVLGAGKVLTKDIGQGVLGVAKIPYDVAKGGVGLVGKGIDKLGIKTPEGLQNIKNSTAEKLLASDWKLNKKTRNELNNRVGESGPGFALKNDLVGKDVEDTINNTEAFKLQKIQEKMNEVKNFGQTITPDVAKRMADTLNTKILEDTKKSYGIKDDIEAIKMLKQEHPEFGKVYDLANEIGKSKEIDYTKLEQLKELYDHLNPENLKFDVTGKPENEFANQLAVQKRAKLQNILEKVGTEKGVDIKQINKDIMGAHSLAKGLNDTVLRKENLNILGLGDTQMAIISGILGGAPGAVGGLLLKKGLSSESFKGGLAKKLYNPIKNETSNILNNTLTNTTPKSRVDMIMNNNSNNPITEIKSNVLPKKSFKELTGNEVKPKKSVLSLKEKTLIKPNQPTNVLNKPIKILSKNGGKVLKKKSVLERVLPSNFKEKAQDLVDKVAEKTGAKTNLLGGEGAMKAPVSNLEKAKNWEKSGKSADDIWKETGWEKGTDGKWKFEIDDSKASLNNVTARQKILPESSLGEILKHDDLYKQYPELKNIRVVFTDKGNMSFDGSAIRIPKPYYKENGLKIFLDKDSKTSILHEIQHTIQNKEGFAKGGSVQNTGDRFGDIERYTNLAGETEARNVQTRLLKTPSERKILRPAKTEDVDRKLQIVKMEGGKSMLLPTNSKQVSKVSSIKDSAGIKLPDGLKIDNEGYLTLYHGGKIPDTAQLRYTEGGEPALFMTANKTEALEYARNKGGVVKEIKIKPNDVTLNQGSGEFEINESGILENGKFIKGGTLGSKKYPDKIYKAISDVWGYKVNPKDIDNMKISEIEDIASQGLRGGSDEFRQLTKQIYEQSKKT